MQHYHNQKIQVNKFESSMVMVIMWLMRSTKTTDSDECGKFNIDGISEE